MFVVTVAMISSDSVTKNKRPAHVGVISPSIQSKLRSLLIFSNFQLMSHLGYSSGPFDIIVLIIIILHKFIGNFFKCLYMFDL